jgi:hypothetical protein
MGIESLATPLVKQALTRALEIEDEQLTLLKRIDRNIERLLGREYDEGKDHLELAARSGPETPAAREEEIKARDCFMAAHPGLGGDPYRQSLVAVQLVAINLLLGEDRGEVQKWALRAHQEAVAATQRRCKEINETVGKRTLTGEDRISRAAQVLVFGVVLLIAVLVAFSVLIPAVFPFGLGGAGALIVGVGILCMAGVGWESVFGLASERLAVPMKRRGLPDVQRLNDYTTNVAELCRAVDVPAMRIPVYEIVAPRGNDDMEYRAVPPLPTGQPAQHSSPSSQAL